MSPDQAAIYQAAILNTAEQSVEVVESEQVEELVEPEEPEQVKRLALSGVVVPKTTLYSAHALLPKVCDDSHECRTTISMAVSL